MKFTIVKEELLEKLSKISNVASTNSANPVTANVLLSVDSESDKMLLTCTDCEVQLSTYAYGVTVMEAGKTTVNAKTLLELLKKAPSGIFKFSIAEDGEKLSASCGKFRSSMVAINADLFPEVISVKPLFEYKINANELLQLIKTTKFCIANDSYRLFLKGLRFQTEGKKLTVIAADGHRLAINACEIEEVEYPTENTDNGFILPKKATEQLYSLLNSAKKTIEDNEEVTISVSSNAISTTVNEVDLLSVKIDCAYPNVSNMLFSNPNHIYTVNKKILAETVARVSIMSNNLNKAVELVFSSTSCDIQAKNSKHEDCIDSIEAGTYSGKDGFSIALNAEYIIQVCNTIDTEQMSLMFADKCNNCMIVPFVSKEEEQGAEQQKFLISRIIV